MLKNAKKELPEVKEDKGRFNIPKVKGHIEGNKTIISNFTEITKSLERNTQQVLKYVLKELATPGEMRKNALILGTKVPASKVNEKINQYAEKFVFCQECNKPDTMLITENNKEILKCHACGAKNAIY